MIFFEKQIKGISAICIILAVIPFIIFISDSKVNYNIPELANQFSGKVTVEIVENGRSRGIYFVTTETSAKQLLKTIGIEYPAKEDFPLDSGMKITINSISKNAKYYYCCCPD